MVAGLIRMYAGSVAPEGYLMCDGSAVSRDQYSGLFDVIGTTFGVGDGATTFNLPDLSGKVPMGNSQTHALASSGGSETVALTDLPAHIHTVPTHGHENTILATTPSLSHTISTQPAFNYNRPNATATRYNARAGQGSRTAYKGTSSVAATLSTKVGVTAHAATACTMSGAISDASAMETETTGSGDAHNNMQPYVTMNYIISIGD